MGPDLVITVPADALIPTGAINRNSASDKHKNMLFQISVAVT